MYMGKIGNNEQEIHYTKQWYASHDNSYTYTIADGIGWLILRCIDETK